MKLTEEEVKNIFVEKEALLAGHFQLTSGRHSDNYMQCAKVLQYPDVTEKFGEAIASRIKESGAKVDVVCAPAIGGIVLGYAVAKALGARSIFAEREGGAGPMKLRRGFAVNSGESVLAVEDVITTGGSLREILTLINEAGGKAAGVASVVERSAAPVDFGTSKTVLLNITLKDFRPDECPKCKQGMPVMKPGSRKA